MKLTTFTAALTAILAVAINNGCIPPAHFATGNGTAEHNKTIEAFKRQSCLEKCYPMNCHDGHMHCCYGTVSRQSAPLDLYTCGLRLMTEQCERCID